MTERAIGVDLADIYESPQSTKPIRTLAWGDRVDLLEEQEKHLKIATRRYPEEADGSVSSEPFTGYIRVPKDVSAEEILVPAEEAAVLRVDFVDVQQGDASVIETPKGKVLLLDGGDNQLFARYLAARFPGTSAENPKEIDCILVSHGDADHFAGLTEIHESESNEAPQKRLFIHPKRIYHNGLVKRPSAVKESEQLGTTVEHDGETVITGLEDDLRTVSDEEMNEPFREWKKALEAFAERGPIEFKRLSDKNKDALSFLADREDIDVGIEVLAPIETQVNGETGLKFLGNPPKKPIVSRPSEKPPTYSGKSVSHTINGHSVVFALRFGKWRFLFSGDLNEQAAAALAEANSKGLRSEVFKVPHHGSADFSPAFFDAVSPVVSVVSSGDESARKEYIHPRATLMNALGRHSRSEDSILFVTELVAFFENIGWSYPADQDKKDQPPMIEHPFYAFRRAAWGLVKVRTDGTRLLVYTNSASARLKEAYAFTVPDDEPQPARVRKV